MPRTTPADIPPAVNDSSLPTLVVHANWSRHRLWLWAEDVGAALAHAASGVRMEVAAPGADGAVDEPGSSATARSEPIVPHPFAASHAALRSALAGLWSGEIPVEDAGARLGLWLPGGSHGPWPSDRLATILDQDAPETDPLPTRVDVAALPVAPGAVARLLLALEDRQGGHAAQFSHALRYWISVARFAVELLEDQRVVPTLLQRKGGPLQAAWHPWLRDAAAASRVGPLIASMPGIVRAADDELRHDAGAILEDALATMVDAMVRDTLLRESYEDAIADRDPLVDPPVAWLAGLLDGTDEVPAAPGGEVAMLRGARRWLASLDETGEGLPYRLLLRLNEPVIDPTRGVDDHADDARWWLSLHLVSPDEPREVIDATALWTRGAVGRGAPGGERASELLLGELGRASRIYPRLERALAESTPTGLFLGTGEAYSFLREHRGVLLEAGFSVEVPDWWDQPQSRLAARLVIESAESSDAATSSGGGLGLQAIVSYRWQIALGDRPMTIEQFRGLAERGVPLVRVGGRWVEIREQDLAGALRFLEEHPGGRMTLLEAMRLAHGAGDDGASLPIAGLEATGWVGEVFGPDADAAHLESIEQPPEFEGVLRPYQKAGLSWLAFLDRFGLGACLADDMGLGKTIQLIALLQFERGRIAAERAGTGRARADAEAGDRAHVGEATPAPDAAGGAAQAGAAEHVVNVGPTLLVAPMSVLSNWQRELGRFAPALRVHLHHGLDRPLGDAFVKRAAESDIVITTYALVTRDRETLERIMWRRVCLDEAQHIKNPPTKQTNAIRSLKTRHRVALTGTPVENRLSELWSIMEFCNPGYLGAATEFRRRFAVPIERHRDRRQADRLRALVRPFILRRVKTDPTVIADLPPLVETKHVVPLSAEQAALYERVVNEMLVRVDRAEGIQRRGLVLAALVKLKQVCNHPAHYLKESVGGPGADAAMIAAGRSGKAQRLMEMVEELLAAGDKALIFTQYREMGHMLVSMIRRDLDVEALFLHGGTPAQRRQQLIDRFQSDDGGAPIFVLSLKAGGVGLNLTAANHVFHYDRWWNPAVENQATDRAFRIGQLRTVHVHKLICAGTLEERIDQMIEQKTELAAQIIGAGESWLTELSTGQLRDLFALRQVTLAADETDAVPTIAAEVDLDDFTEDEAA
ncbi:MAG: DEAD/DEAH box helicase [Phycisphaerales bacterium]